MTNPYRAPEFRPDERMNSRALVLSVVVIAVSFVLPLAWVVVLARIDIGSDARVFSHGSALVITAVTVIGHGLLLLLMIHHFTGRPLAGCISFLAWVPGFVLNCLSLFVLWFWNLRV